VLRVPELRVVAGRAVEVDVVPEAVVVAAADVVVAVVSCRCPFHRRPSPMAAISQPSSMEAQVFLPN
jgi:hypothetical protein